jgi:hypothetical protein
VNEKTEATPPKGLEEAPGAASSPAPVEEPERSNRRPEELRDADLRGQDLTKWKGSCPSILLAQI